MTSKTMHCPFDEDIQFIYGKCLLMKYQIQYYAYSVIQQLFMMEFVTKVIPISDISFVHLECRINTYVYVTCLKGY